MKMIRVLIQLPEPLKSKLDAERKRGTTAAGLIRHLETLKGRASHYNTLSAASEWIATSTTTPTRAQILERQRTICTGHFQPNATKANKELALIRAACRWGLYQDRWGWWRSDPGH